MSSAPARPSPRKPMRPLNLALPLLMLPAVLLLAVHAEGRIRSESPPAPNESLSHLVSPPPFDPTHLLPTQQIGTDRFLTDHPEADGRGIVVAIFDTGVDPGAPGMQVTSDGRPKVIDLVDASGSGDVDTTTIRTVSEEGTLEGLTGRTLIINPQWVNPTGEFRLGIASGDALFPGQAMPRIRRDRARAFAEAQRVAIAEAQAALNAFDRAHPRPTRRELEERTELTMRLDLLRDHLASDLPEPGPVFDCLVWHDGERWMAAVDTDEDGDFRNEIALTNFRDCLEFGTFSGETLINFALNIYDEGDTLSIVVDCGDHGTHVAGIVAANHPDRPDLNGVAPGAQIVGIKIGDTRLGSTSTNNSEIRALSAVLRSGAQVINKSYGGPTAFPNHGRMSEIQRRIIDDHRVVYVASAGNSGPAFSTVGSPGGTSSAIIGVGATVDPEMARAQYGLPRSGGEMQFTWSSRGPTLDGDFGVDITAPGGAFAPIPNWSLAGSRQMNGTSMSSPTVAGGIALLLSAAHAHSLDPAPAAVKRAVMATARPVPGMSSLDVGPGMIDVPAAWAHMTAHANLDDDAARYLITIPTDAGVQRGIYLRQPQEIDRPIERRVTVRPTFPTEHCRESLVQFERRVTLRSDAPWVESGESVLLTSAGRNFLVRVDPRDLSPGVHVATIFGFDAQRPERGPLFRVPVTVMKPHPIETEPEWRHTEELHLGEGEIARMYYAVPPGATWADITLRRLDREAGQTLVLQTVQPREGESFMSRQFRQWIDFEESAEVLRSIALEGGRSLEVAVARNWSGLRDASFAYEIRFRGLRAGNLSTGAMVGGAGVVGVDVTSSLRREHIQPSLRLTHLRQSIAPAKFEERTLTDPRDVLPNDMIPHELIVEHPLTIEEDATYVINPAAAMQPLAVPTFEGLLWMILDRDQRMVAFGGYTGTEIRLTKGSYTLRMQYRHDDPSAMAPLRDLPVFVDQQLSSPLTIHASATPEAALRGARMDPRALQTGETARVWLRVPPSDRLPGNAKPGDLLLGSITFGGPGGSLVGATSRPGGWPVVMTVPPKPASPSAPRASDTDLPDERSARQKHDESMRDHAIERLRALGTSEEEETLYSELEASLLETWPDHLPLIEARLSRLAGQSETDTEAIVEAADRLIAMIDQEALAAHFGTSIDDTDAEERRLREEMTRQRSMLIDALRHRATALLRAAREADDDDRDETTERYLRARSDLTRWSDWSASEHATLRIDEARLKGRPATALSVLRSELSRHPDNRASLRTIRTELLTELGWTHWATRADRQHMLAAPAKLPRF